MKTLRESLFDDDLVSKEVSLGFDAVYSILKRDIYEKFSEKYEKKEWIMSFNGLGLSIEKPFVFMTEDNLCNTIRMNYSVIFYDKDDKFYISIPSCTCIYRDAFTYSYNRTETSLDATRKWILKKYNRLKTHDIYNLKSIEVNSNNISIIIEMITNMIDGLISNDMDKKINKYIDQYCKRKKMIPGVVLDQGIMKHLVK